MSEHLESRFKCLIAHETKVHEILEQCGSPKHPADPLYANFRYDEICLALSQFRAIGLTLPVLLKFQLKVCGTVYPWNLEYNTLRQDVNRRFNVFPLIIVMASSECDVVTAYRFARKYNIPLALRSGSHCFEGFSLGPGMIIDQSRRCHVGINLKNRTYRVEPGVLIGPLVDILTKYQLGIPIGSCPNNGFTGFCLGGGISLVTKKYGTGSDNILEARILLANGTIVTANRKHHKSLYWALRGAGIGNYGIVLSMKCQAYPLKKVLIYTLSYRFDQLEDILPLWTQEVQRIRSNHDITSDIKIIGGRGPIQISGYVFNSNKKELEDFLKPFIALAQDYNIERVTYADGVRAFAGKGRWFPFFKFKNAFLKRAFSPEELSTIKEFMSQGDNRDYMVIDALGGVNDEIGVRETAYSHRNYLGWFHVNAQWQEQEEALKKLAWITKFYKSLAPEASLEFSYGVTGTLESSLSFAVYQNAPDLMLTQSLVRYYAPNLSRLVRIKNRYDPANIFQYEQSIPPSLPESN